MEDNKLTQEQIEATPSRLAARVRDYTCRYEDLSFTVRPLSTMVRRGIQALARDDQDKFDLHKWNALVVQYGLRGWSGLELDFALTSSTMLGRAVEHASEACMDFLQWECIPGLFVALAEEIVTLSGLAAGEAVKLNFT